MAEFKIVDVRDAAGIPVHNIIEVDGQRLCTFFRPNDVAAKITHDVKDMELRDDDVMLCTPPKSGTHWGWEIISMLLNGKAETISQPKESTMLEAHPRSVFMDMSSPRVLNSHMYLRLLPRQLKEKRTKIVLILRNPKDVSVSYYHHHSGINLYDYQGKFEDYLSMFMKGELDYSDWFDYVLDFEEEINRGDYNIHLVYFEDLKENGLDEIKKISDFLCVPRNDALCEAICEKCQFSKMAVDKKEKGEFVDTIFKKNFSMYRKGQIGDWKNYFTVAMNEKFDRLFCERMKNTKLNFRYTAKL